MADSNTETRTTLNQLAGLRAGQEQLTKDMEQARGQLKALLILNAYLLGVGLLCWLALRQGVKK
jgi:hypothetical protein